MSILEIKQQLSRLSDRQREEIRLYLMTLKRGTPAWKKDTARKIRAMQAGKATSLEELEKRYARG